MSARRFSQLVARLSYPRLLLVFGVLLLPTVLAPYHSDDFFHLLLLSDDQLLERGGDGSLFGLFSFIDADPANREQMIALGVLPWWTTDSFYFRFWRPLAEASHWLDYRLFGLNPMMAHLHSILWFLLLGWVVSLLVRQTLKPPREMLLLIFAIFLLDGQHIATITWIANRNALMAAVFAFACLGWHIRWRQSGDWRFAALAHLSLAIAMLAGEIALSVGAYLFAWAMLLDAKGRARGFVVLLGYAVIVIAYLLLHRALGFGADTSLSFYVSPFTHPIGFLQTALERLPVYIASGFVTAPAGISWAGGESFSGVSFLINTLAWLLLPLIIGLGWIATRRDKTVAFWLWGGLLSIVPVCSALPQDRLTLFMTVGVDVFLGWLIWQCWVNRSAMQPFGQRWLRNTAAILAVMHLIFSPIHLGLGSLFMWFETQRLESHALEFNGEQALEGKTLVVLQMPLGQSSTLLGIRRLHGKTIPDASLQLASDDGRLHVDVISPYRLEVSRDIGFVIGHESSFRLIAESPLAVGEEIALPGFRIRIMSLNSDGYPQRLQLDFDTNLYSGDVLFYSIDAGVLKPVLLPPVGGSLETQGMNLPWDDASRAPTNATADG
ncbi:Uncharacterised protein [BD1-7 clade bacterium]|uniref:Glycosyltransferase RgtA/B/C/D-like domain-containing protein n=1 Tax=BD1-7 clade bacterium TaxID=2029982 RepID=A0A5S9QAL6_9GAMM|nr:Uncharacterised protein [BD1-7 clade bacterium]